uniref:Nanos-type domain-containing protein n=1 Tax=Astatotilapia calliptera TaxID=8154 RepID=A0AAX7UQT7_ASTCA
MTTMPRQLEVQNSILTGGDSFNMWHDYLNLSQVFEKLCSNREVDNRDTERPKKGQAPPWSKVHTSTRGKKSSKNSSQSSPTSSASDTSSSASSSDYCRLCKQNGETPRVYLSHKLKSDDGIVFCPVLRNYTCPICEATGDSAHTRKYCPQMKGKAAGRMQTRPFQFQRLFQV